MHIGATVTVFAIHLRDYKKYHNSIGTVVGIRSPCICSPQDSSLSRDVNVLMGDSKVITIPEGCCTVSNHSGRMMNAT